MRMIRSGLMILCLSALSAVGCATGAPLATATTDASASIVDTNTGFSTSIAAVTDSTDGIIPTLQPVTLEADSTLVAQVVDSIPSELTFSDESLISQPDDPNQMQPAQPPTPTPAVTAAVEFETTTGVDTSNGPVEVSFTLSTPRMVDIFARDVDGNADPQIMVFNDRQRLLTFSDDHFSQRDDLGPLDAAVENALLLPGTYSVRVETAAPGRVNLSIEEGTGGALGTGQITLIPATMPAGQRFLQRVQLNANELVTITALSQTPDFDTRLRLQTTSTDTLARNDDIESFDILPEITDAQITNFVVPAADEYVIEVRAFSSNQGGDFILMIQRYGTLEAVADEAEQMLTGEILSRQRIDFPLSLQGGELVTITARAAGSTIDPQIVLIDADNIVVISNDDHSTDDESLSQFDARFTNFVVPADGEYILQLESYSGRGGYEILIERAGRINPEVIGRPIDPQSNEIAPMPGEQPEVIQPESSAEVTPSS